MKGKAKRLFTVTNLAITASALFVVSIIPVIYLSFINRATGDDYGYGVHTHAALLATRSLSGILGAAAKTVRDHYEVWQGTWSSIFLFTLQPEVFNDRAYVAVTIVTVTLWIAVTTFTLYYLLVRMMGFTKSGFALINALFLLVNVHFAGSNKETLFFYNGIIHYQLPYLLCLLLIGLVICFGQRYKWRYLLAISFIAAYLGGSSYQPALLGFAVMLLAIAYFLPYKRDKRILWLLLPLLLETIGLIISMKAPGNWARGGAGFGFGIDRAWEAILMSFVAAYRQIGSWRWHNAMSYIILVLVALAVLYTAVKSPSAAGTGGTGGRYRFPLPILFVLATFCIYAIAAHAPEVYAGVWVSSGYENFKFLTFALMILADAIYLSGWFAVRCGSMARSPAFGRLLIGAAILCGALVPVLALFPRVDLGMGKTAFVESYGYIRSGAAGEYRRQMELQTAILRDEETIDAIIPYISGEQGPLMHMSATSDPDAYTNLVMRDFYGKNSVVAIDRQEWDELYGQAWPEGKPD